MFDALARLADGNARRVGLFAIVFFVLAAAIGGGVASRLDPYGADDPATGQHRNSLQWPIPPKFPGRGHSIR